MHYVTWVLLLFRERNCPERIVPRHNALRNIALCRIHPSSAIVGHVRGKRGDIEVQTYIFKEKEERPERYKAKRGLYRAKWRIRCDNRKKFE